MDFIEKLKQAQASWLWRDSKVKSKFEAWCDLMVLASEPEGVELSHRELADRWGWTKTAVQRFVLKLIDMNQLRIESESKVIRIYDCESDSCKPERIESESKANRKRIGTQTKFTPPALPEIEEYFIQNACTAFEAGRFENYYGSVGWKVGKNTMKDWRKAAGGWISRWKEKQPKSTPPKNNYQQEHENWKREAGWIQ